MRQVFADIGERVDDVLAVPFGGDVEVAVAHRLKPRAGRLHALGHLEADFAPLIDHPDAVIFVRLIRRAVEQLEAQILGARLLQQPLRLGTRFLDIGPIAGELLQLLFVRGERRTGKGDATYGTDNRHLGEIRRAAPAVDRQSQRAPHADVVERLSLVVWSQDPAAIPVAGLYRDLVA